MANYIRGLKAENEALKDGIEGFRFHLATSDKYRGTDNGERKDWIAVADVLRWLEGIMSSATTARNDG